MFHPVYTQLHGTFIPYLSIIDLVFNHGPASLGILLQGGKAFLKTRKNHTNLPEGRVHRLQFQPIICIISTRNTKSLSSMPLPTPARWKIFPPPFWTEDPEMRFEFVLWQRHQCRVDGYPRLSIGLIVHLAAESHVTRSIYDNLQFFQTDVIGNPGRIQCSVQVQG